MLQDPSNEGIIFQIINEVCTLIQMTTFFQTNHFYLKISELFIFSKAMQYFTETAQNIVHLPNLAQG